MISKWHSHLKTQDDKELFVRSVLGSKSVLERLRDMLKEEEKGMDRSETDQRIYDLPNWDYRQAHKNGYRSCLNLIYKIIDLDQKEQHDTGPTVSTRPNFTTAN